jgi:two-component system, sensor histidine kinase
MSMMPTTDLGTAHPGLEALADGFFMVDAKWQITYWNAAATRFLRLTREEVLGRSLWQMVPTLLPSVLGERLRTAMGGTATTEFLIPHLPGCCTGHYLVRTTPLAGGGVAVHIRDATVETRTAERYQQLLESIRDGFIAVEPDGSIVYINRVAEELLRLPRSRGLGTQLWALLPPHLAEVADGIRRTMDDGVARHIRRIYGDGPVLHGRYFDLWIHPLHGGGVALLFQDVSRRVERETELARYAAEAEEANRAKGRFFAAVSHELRTPLNAIVGYLHLLSTETYGELPVPAVRAASRAGVCAEHLSHLVDDLLLMTTAEIDRLPLHLSTLDLQRFLPTALEPIRHQAEAKRLGFHLDIEPGLPPVESDPDRLRQLLHALLSNAVKFTDRGAVRIEVRPLDENPVESAPEAGGWGSSRGARIRVIDTGPGIPPEARQRIFEAFEQLGDPSRSESMSRGAGLGLALARRLATLLRARLTLEEPDGPGSVFRLDLPGREEVRMKKED